MPDLPAARQTDPTAHAGGVAGGLIGAAAGAALGAVVAGPVGAIVGGLLGGLVGAVAVVQGEITHPCFPEALIEGLPAARVSDFNTCQLHPPNQIISGSEFVVFGGLFAARLTDKSVCTGEITDAADHTIIGGPTLTFHVHQSLWGKATGTASGNSMVAISEETGTIYILSFLEYSGDGASAEFAAAAKAQIEDMWGGTATINGKEYQVNVNVQTSVRDPSDPPTDGYDQIHVGSDVDRANQHLFGDGWGNQQADDADPDSWVAAHEYGHSLGVADEYHDTPNGSEPDDPTKTNNIMSQTWADGAGNPPHTYNNQYEQIVEGYGWDP